MTKPTVAVIGAGPAGLTASWKLSQAGVEVCVFEADPKYVGGIAKTVEYKGFRFDIGGHRFFSKSDEIESLWTELLGNDLLVRPRSSRIFYAGKFYSYPLNAKEAFFNLGSIETARCILSFAWSRLFPRHPAVTFEDWVSNQFGKRLFEIFFKTYTEKVWGMRCDEISADWAAQRIQGLSLAGAIWSSLFPRKQHPSRSQTIKTLINSFRYPRLGPGMMWEEAAQRTRASGGQVLMGMRVTKIMKMAESSRWRVFYTASDGSQDHRDFSYVISSAPLRELMHSLVPKPSDTAMDASNSLRYRDFLTVALIVKPTKPFDDNWIYIHDPNVKVGRIQNFGSWSPELVPDPQLACYGLEYFCFEGDGLWNSSDESLVDLAKGELAKLGLVNPEDVIDGTVVRQAKAYPVYDDHYATHVDCIRRELDAHYPNLFLVGRNGMHKYNNQDHSMMTSLLVVKNILAGKTLFDVWRVNQDAEYHEESSPTQGTSGRLVPTSIKTPDEQGN
ncbi:MAG: NAD(P)/FAD-dependent oxidoreductase [Pirellula sp.]